MRIVGELCERSCTYLCEVCAESSWGWVVATGYSLRWFRSRSKYKTLSEWCLWGVWTLALWAINCLLHDNPLTWLTSDIDPCIGWFQFSGLWGVVLPICWRMGLWGIGWANEPYLSPSILIELSHCMDAVAPLDDTCDLSTNDSSSILDSCHLLSRIADETSAALLDALQWLITAGKLDLPWLCLLRSFIETTCHLSGHFSPPCLPFAVGDNPQLVLTSLIDPCHLSRQPLLPAFWDKTPPFTLLTSDNDPWCHRSDVRSWRAGNPLDTLTSDIDPCHFRVSLLEALPLDVVTTLSLPSLEVESSQVDVGLCATASLSLLNLNAKFEFERENTTSSKQRKGKRKERRK